MHRRFSKTASGKPLPPFIFMTDAARCPDPVAVAETLPRGSGIILRDYRSEERRWLARELVRVGRGRGLFVLIGADWQLALEAGAAGVHLPEWAGGLRAAGPLPRGFLVTASVHGPESFPKVAAARADAVLIAPVFATASHPQRPPLGLHGFLRLLRRSPVPAYALGGMDFAALERFPPHPKLAGVAGISMFLGTAKS